ncbi:potassium channel family protein [Methanofollis fontis]|uniref:Ion transporter n=1 Tax=Methanofollis fontis TaxID=2052832 RepID=A0A483CQI0_9EURY|nr:potassium channel family protein [Methanofollis fontis]TAJ43411.1 ion transporter [Methanofollis fontis]
MTGNGDADDIVAHGMRVHRRLEGHKYLLLALPLVLLLVLYPYLENSAIGMLALKIVSTATLITAVFSVSERRGPFYFAVFLAVPAIGIGWSDYFFQYPHIVLAQGISSILLYSFTTLAILRSIIRGRLTDDMIFGAVAIYLLMGITWANAYSVAAAISPETFMLSGGGGPGGIMVFSDFLYFSFITLTTVGYGDITPLTAPVRSLAYLEAISGSLFMAVFIARLIGSLSSGADEGDRK